MQVPLGFLVIGDASRVSGVDLKEGEEASLNSPKHNIHSTNTLKHTIIFLKCMIKMSLHS